MAFNGGQLGNTFETLRGKLLSHCRRSGGRFACVSLLAHQGDCLAKTDLLPLLYLCNSMIELVRSLSEDEQSGQAVNGRIRKSSGGRIPQIIGCFVRISCLIFRTVFRPPDDFRIRPLINNDNKSL